MELTAEELVGRHRETARIGALLDRAEAGRGAVVLISGEAGIGKTALLDRAMQLAAARGFSVAVGRCPAGESPPYWPWTQVLRALTGRAATAGPAGERSHAVLFAEVAEQLEQTCRARPVLVAVDDLHWADPSSVSLTSFMVSVAAGLPCLLAFGLRDDPAEIGPELRATLDRLPADVVRVPLEGLAEADTSRLIHQVLGADPPGDVVGQVRARAGGNPLFVKEVARLLAATGRVEAGNVPEGVRQVLSRRAARVTPETYEVLAAAALIDDFEPALLVVLTDLDVPRVMGALDEAVAARLVTRHGEGHEFAHALIRQTFLEQLRAPHKVDLHRRAGTALEASLQQEVRPDLRAALAARAADHWQHVPDGGRPRAARLAVEAAENAAEQLGFDQAARLYGWARDLGASEVETLTAMGEVQVLAGRFAEGRATLSEACERASREGRGEVLARAVLAAGAGVGGFEVDVRDDRQVRFLHEALELMGEEGSLRAAALARLALVDSSRPVEERVGMLDEATSLARRRGDPATEISTLAARCDVLSGPDHVDGRLAATARMVAIAERQSDPFMLLLARRHRLLVLLERGDLVACDEQIALYERTADRLRVPLYSWLVPVWRGMRALLDGDAASAAELCDEAERLARSAGSHNADVLEFTLRFAIARASGSMAGMEPGIARMVREYAGYPSAEGAHAVYLLATGRRDGAARVLRRRMAAGLGSVPRDSEWLETLWNLGEVAVAVDDRSAAEAIHEALVPYSELWAVDGVGAACYGAVAHQLGVLATYLGRGLEARRWLERAVAIHRDRGADHLARSSASLLDRLGVGPAGSRVPRQEPARGQLVRDGHVWRVIWEGVSATVRSTKGLGDIARLLARPEVEVHVLDLVGGGVAGGGAGPLADDEARRSYRRRLAELEEELAEAERFADVVRAERLEAEREALVEELSRAFGLGGRARTAGDPVERARKAVGMRVATAVRAVTEVHPALGRHLQRSIVTGRYCSYRPESPVLWTVSDGPPDVA